MPVGGRPQLAENRQQPVSIRRPISSSAGALPPDQIEEVRARVGGDSTIFITRSGVIWTSLSSMYQPPTIFTCSISRSASTRSGLATKPRSWSASRRASASSLPAASIARCSSLIWSGESRFVILEVEEGDPPVLHQQVVAGMDVGVEVLQVVDRAEAEAEDDLAVDVALVLGQALHRLESLPLDVIAHQHPPAGETRVDLGDVDEGCPS